MLRVKTCDVAIKGYCGHTGVSTGCMFWRAQAVGWGLQKRTLKQADA